MSKDKLIHEEILVASVFIPAGRRPTSEDKVHSLAASIKEIGLLQPIVVDDDHRLIAWRHRLDAYILLKRDRIPAIIVSLSDLLAQLAEIDENLERSAYTALEYSQALRRRKEIYIALHPATKHGGNHAGENSKAHDRAPCSDPAPTFAEETAAKTGQSVRTVQDAVALADKLDSEAATTIADTPVADNKSELRQLGQLPPEQQREVATKIKAGEAATVEEAVKPKQTPPVKEPTVLERMAESNKRLESFARKITGLLQEAKELGEPHLDGAGRMEILEGQLKQAANTVRAAKGAGVCPYCRGKWCKHCLKTGWANKTTLDSAPQTEKAA